jgi:UrcA family protein
MMKGTDTKLALTPILAPILAIAATIATFSIPDAAMAQTKRQSVRIGYADLDLDTEAGQRILGERIRRAARKVCRLDEVRTGTHILPADAAECYQQALRGAREQIARATAGQHQGA